MGMEKELFDDLVAACHEAIEHEKGNLKLKSHVVTIPDDEAEASQLLYRKIEGLTEAKKLKAMRYIDELAAV